MMKIIQVRMPDKDIKIISRWMKKNEHRKVISIIDVERKINDLVKDTVEKMKSGDYNV